MLYTTTETKSFGTGKLVVFGFFGVLLLVAIAGTIVECSKIGNDPAYDSELLKSASEFRTTKQYETVSL